MNWNSNFLVFIDTLKKKKIAIWRDDQKLKISFSCQDSITEEEKKILIDKKKEILDFLERNKVFSENDFFWSEIKSGTQNFSYGVPL